MTARGTWKAFERRVAFDLGGQRIPVTGIDRDGADVRTPMFAIQVKLRNRLPDWLWGWLDGICLSAKGEGRIGVLVLRRPRQRDADALVVVRYRDWCLLHGTIRDNEEPAAGDCQGSEPVSSSYSPVLPGLLEE
jgi:hypothetical protein